MDGGVRSGLLIRRGRRRRRAGGPDQDGGSSFRPAGRRSPSTVVVVPRRAGRVANAGFGIPSLAGPRTRPPPSSARRSPRRLDSTSRSPPHARCPGLGPHRPKLPVMAGRHHRCGGPLRHAGNGRYLHGPGPGRPDDRNGSAEQVAAHLRTTFREAAIDEANRPRVVTRFQSILQPGGEDRGKRSVKAVRPLLAKGLDGLTQRDGAAAGANTNVMSYSCAVGVAWSGHPERRPPAAVVPARYPPMTCAGRPWGRGARRLAGEMTSAEAAVPSVMTVRLTPSPVTDAALARQRTGTSTTSTGSADARLSKP